MTNSEIKNFSSWIKEINNFENLIKQYYDEVNSFKYDIDQEGYIINKNIIDDLKQKLFYDELHEYINNTEIFKQKCEEKFNSNNNIKINKCKPQIYKNSKELKESIQDNEFIIVNYLIRKIINDGELIDNEGLIKYKIKSKYLIVFINNETILFKHNSNIINKDSFIEIKNIYQDEINKIYNSIIIYNKFENLLIKELKKK